MKSDSLKGALAYYLTLWMMVLGTLVILDFSKHVDDLLFGMTYGELAANLFAALPLVWLLSLLLALLSAGLERAKMGRAAHFLVAFAFITVNLWSLKVGAAGKLASTLPPRRAVLGYVAGLLALLASLAFARGRTHRLSAIDEGKARYLKLMAAATLLLGLPALSPALPSGGESDKPNIIVVTFDALSASHMPLYGYHRDTTPNIDKVAKESWVFDDFRSNYTNTPAAMLALQGNLPIRKGTGVWTDKPGLFDILANYGYPNRAYFGYFLPHIYFGTQLPGQSVTRSGKRNPYYKALAAVMPDRTLVYLSDLLSEDWLYYWAYSSEYDDDIFWSTNHFPGDQSLQSALDYLERHPTGAYVWVHLWEPHFPYWPDQDLAHAFGPWTPSPAEFINRPYSPGQMPWVEELRNRYDASILTADRYFGHFLEVLQERGQYDNSILIISADHGEAHDMGFIGHSGPSVVEPITHVPLIIHTPGSTTQKRISTRASQIDIAPTLLQMLGVPPVASLPGESLIPYIEDPKKKSPRVHHTVSYSAFWGLPGEIAVYLDDFKAVYSNTDPKTVRLYDLSKDPRAEKDIAKERPDKVAEVMKKAGVW